jgi:hypothetical protein
LQLIGLEKRYKNGKIVPNPNENKDDSEDDDDDYDGSGICPNC